MSLANAIGNSATNATLDTRKAFAYHSNNNIVASLVSFPVGGASTATENIPYLQATDNIFLAYNYGGTVAGPISWSVVNAGTATAQLQMSAGAVAGSAAVFALHVTKGPNA